METVAPVANLLLISFFVAGIRGRTITLLPEYSQMDENAIALWLIAYSDLWKWE